MRLALPGRGVRVGGAGTPLPGFVKRDFSVRAGRALRESPKPSARGTGQKPGKSPRRRADKGDPDWREKFAAQKNPPGRRGRSLFLACPEMSPRQGHGPGRN